MTERYLSGESPMSARGRMTQRRFHAKARDETIDSAGRIRIPGHMLEHAGLEGSCIVLGVNDHLEVWHPDRWATHEAQVDAEIERMTQEQSAGAEG
jgi:MraZ protein